MRISVCITILLLMFSTNSALAQYNMELEGYLTTNNWPTYRLKLNDDILYAATDTGLEILDVSDPYTPVPLGSCATFGSGIDIAVEGSLVYLACGEDGLRIIDASDQAEPEVIRQLNRGPQGIHGVFVVADLMYIMAYNDGLYIFDVSNPQQPQQLGYLNLPGEDVLVSGDYAYIAGTANRTRIIDISDPAAPVQVSEYYYNSGNNYEIEIAGDYLYAANHAKGLQVVDISDPLNPDLIGLADFAGQATDIDLAGNYLYISRVENDNGLAVYDVSDLTNPILIFADTDGSSSIEVQGAYAFMSKGHLVTLDVSDPSAPVEVYSGGEDGRMSQCEVIDDIAYVNYKDGGWIFIDVSDPSHPTEIGRYPTPNDLINSCYLNGYLLGAVMQHGLIVLDVSDLNNPIEVAQLYPGVDIEGIAVDNSTVYLKVESPDEAIAIYDFTDPANPVEIASHLYDYGGGIVAQDGIVFCEDDSSRVDVYDLTDPTEMIWLTSMYYVNQPPERLALEENDLYVAYGNDIIRKFDVTLPRYPREVGSIELNESSWFNTMDVEEGILSVAYNRFGHVLINWTLNWEPTVVGYSSHVLPALGADLVGNWGYFTSGTAFTVFDCGDALTVPFSYVDVALTVDDSLTAETGRFFAFGAQLTSHLFTGEYLNVWTEVITPNGGRFGPLLTAQNVNFWPGREINLPTITQQIPTNAPLGEYIYIVNIGHGPNSMRGFGEFKFEVVENSAQSGDVVGEWTVGMLDIALSPEVNPGDVVTLPSNYAISAAYPNPFNPSTTLSVNLPVSAELTVAVYNITGQQVAELARGTYPAGLHTLTFDGSHLSGGVYFLYASANSWHATQKVVLAK